MLGNTGLIMIRIIFFTILFFIFYYVLLNLFKVILTPRRRTSQSEPEELVQDPYCKVYIPKRSAVRKKIDRSTFYFCNQECLENYVKGDKEDRQ